MGNLSLNLSRHEVECHCGCGFDSIDVETVCILQKTCDHFAKVLGKDKVVLRINSGARCEKHNKKVGGALESKHLQGRAIDFYIEGVTVKAIYDYLDKTYPTKYGLGLYNDFIHFDTRTFGPARF